MAKLLKKPSAKKFQPDTQAIQKKLAEVAALDQKATAIRSKISNQLEALAALESEQEALKTEIKRIVTPQAGEGVEHLLPEGKRVVFWEAEGFEVHVTYPRAPKSYDPAKLPKKILDLPGIIQEVSYQAISELPEDLRELAKDALMEGTPRAPSVSVKRTTRQ